MSAVLFHLAASVQLVFQKPLSVSSGLWVLECDTPTHRIHAILHATQNIVFITHIYIHITGVVSGYLSHVPHNLSTLKLMTPQKSYGQLFNEFAVKSEARLPETMSPKARVVCGRVLSVLAPVGVHIRTTQMVGSFIILNGLIRMLSWNMAVEASKQQQQQASRQRGIWRLRDSDAH